MDLEIGLRVPKSWFLGKKPFGSSEQRAAASSSERATAHFEICVFYYAKLFKAVSIFLTFFFPGPKDRVAVNLDHGKCSRENGLNLSNVLGRVHFYEAVSNVLGRVFLKCSNRVPLWLPTTRHPHRNPISHSTVTLRVT